MKYLSRARAFTLPEVLIVITIIGVVAALVIPTINADIKQKQKVSKLRKVHAELNSAFDEAVLKYGDVTPQNWFAGTTPSQADLSTAVAKKMLEFMNISKDCGLTGTDCTSTGNFKVKSGLPEAVDSQTDVYKAALNADVSILFKIISQVGMSYASYINNARYPSGSLSVPYWGRIFVDLDGPNKGAFKYGDDIFGFIFTQKGVYPMGLKDQDLLFPLSDCFLAGFYCTGWVIENGNFDYLKADNTGKCPNGNQLSWTRTTCK